MTWLPWVLEIALYHVDIRQQVESARQQAAEKAVLEDHQTFEKPNE